MTNPPRPPLPPPPQQQQPLPQQPSTTTPPEATASWPLHNRAARPIALLTILVIAVVAAAAVPLGRPGLGWLLSGLVAMVGLIVIAVDAARHQRRLTLGRLAAEQVGWGVIALALLGVGTLRAAGWLFVLCLIAAGLAWCVAVGRGRTPLGLFFAIISVPAALVRGSAWYARGCVQGDLRGRDRRTLARSAVAAAVGLLLVAVFGALFASADPAFASIVTSIVPDADAASALRWGFLFMAAASLAIAGAFLVANPTRFTDLTMNPPRPLRRIEWVLPIGALVALFALFIVVQLTILFGGEGYVMRTAGLTFAQYARRGFGQLIVVTLLTLVVMGITIRKAPRATAGDRVLLRSLLGVLAVSTLMIVASALWRMWVYEQAYGFTRLRLLVSAFELWLGLVFLLIIAAGVRLRTSWLPRFALASGFVVLLGLAWLNPDGFIAGQNIDRYERTGKIDIAYLRDLSPDAATELDRLPGLSRKCALLGIAEDLRNARDGWTEYNAGRAAARRLDLPGAQSDWSECSAVYRP
ncbi:MAG: DUF4173 domain-containing protein [Micromonosporaceae bacterium]|nr:DUF4173 domain-containing protein [Micromonosporaceae bacterium]